MDKNNSKVNEATNVASFSNKIQQPINSDFQTQQQIVNDVQVQQQIGNNAEVQQSIVNDAFKEQKKSKSNISKSKIIIIMLVIITFIGFFVYFKSKNSSTKNNDKNLIGIFNMEKPIKIKKDDKYGFISTDGKIIIEPIYSYADDFYGDYTVVSIKNPDTTSKDEYKSIIIDKKGKQKNLSEEYDSIKYYSDCNVWMIDSVLYDSKFKQISDKGLKLTYESSGYFTYVDNKNNESGIMNSQGKKIFTWDGTIISMEISETTFNQIDLYAKVYNYSDLKRDIIISLSTGDVLYKNEDSDKYYILVDDDGVFSVHISGNISNNDKYFFFKNNKLLYESTDDIYKIEVYDYENEILNLNYGYDYYKLGKPDMNGYYDMKNNKMIDNIYSNEYSKDVLMAPLYGYDLVYKSGKYGLSQDGKEILPAEYNGVDFLNYDLFTYLKNEKNQVLLFLEKDDKIILYDLKNKNEINSFDSKYVYNSFDSPFYKIYSNNNDAIIIYNILTNKSKSFEKSSDIDVNSNYITVKKDGKLIYYNSNLEEIYTI